MVASQLLTPDERLIVALDVSSAAEAQKVVGTLGESVRSYKVGMQLYTAAGPNIVRDLVGSGRQVFLDLKYHDIPNTVVAAVREAAALGVGMLTVHASGGTKMLRAAAEAARSSSKTPLHILAVTVLTSMGGEDLNQIGVPDSVADQVVRLASMALKAGCTGVVSSAQEVRTLRAKLGNRFLAVTPGVRPTGTEPGDQARVVTPTVAIASGATHIVVGRPILQAKDPRGAARQIQQEVSAAVGQTA
jgi:orotidine-5'-phosphate decarboxylase